MEKDTRQLAAIMLTDVVGYTALTQADEALTLALLEEHAALLRPLFAEHGGREVKSTGDGFLVEFGSALQAVRCAVEIQRALHERNVAVPLDRTIHVRIGVHLGDVVHRGGDIFGDGVNITARIEPLAEPGGICLSRQVYDQVWNKVDLRMTSLGKRDLKNVKVPIEVYEMLLPWMQNEVPAPQAGDRTRLAVLPLVSMSPEPGDEYFADGLTEELIFTLSKVSGLHVIALTSVMKYRGAKKAVSEIGKELSVGAVLEGSVRKAGNRLRITLQLIDAVGEAHLWAEAYDRTLEDVFAVQTEVARSVAAALEIQLVPKPTRATDERVSADPEAYVTYLKGRAFLSRRTVDNLRRAIQCFERAIELDPGHAAAHAALATAYGILPNYAASVPADVWAKAKASALKALALDGDLPEAHAALGMILLSEWDWEGAEREIRRAIELAPSYALAHHWLGMVLFGFARFDEAIAALKKSQTLDPLSAVQHGALGQVYACAGKPDLALAEFEMDLALGEDNRVLRVFRGEIYLDQGQYELARMDFEKARELAGAFDPNVELVLASLGEAMGEKGAVEASLDRVLEQAKREPVSPYLLALFYFALGRNDEGFALLERAYAERDGELGMLKVDPRLASRRSDPRYAELLKRVGLAE
jgi:TolB-like protein/class 3 adenylate cyclase/Tfp pilus assembly protein PilF